MTDRYRDEARHFDGLVCRRGESWWGHETPAGRRRLLRRACMVAEALPLGPDFRVMEIAAGAGALTEAVLTQAPSASVTATDISPVSVRRLRARVGGYANVLVECADITSLNIADASFDAVIGNSALHHVDVPICLRELHRVLVPGGKLLVFEPNLLNPEVFAETKLARGWATKSLDYSAQERTHTRWIYARMLRHAGFSAVKVRPFDFLHPITPSRVVPIAYALSLALERIPLARELSGSLVLSAAKPL